MTLSKKVQAERAAAKKAVVSSTKKAPPIKATKKEAAPKMTEAQEKVLTLLKTRTEEAFVKFFKPKKEEEKDEKFIAMEKAIVQFGGYAPAVAELMSIVTGMKLSIVSSDGQIPTSRIQPGSCLVPTRNPNGHSYALNKVCMATVPNQQSGFFSLNQKSGGNNLTMDIESLRLPTDEELQSFVLENYSQIVRTLNIVIL